MRAGMRDRVTRSIQAVGRRGRARTVPPQLPVRPRPVQRGRWRRRPAAAAGRRAGRERGGRATRVLGVGRRGVHGRSRARQRSGRSGGGPRAAAWRGGARGQCALASSAAYLLVENRFAEAAANAEESARLGREIGAENLIGLPLGVLAMVAAVRGRDDEARQLADEVAGFANERGLALPAAFAVWSLANVDLAQGRHAQALERYDALAEVTTGLRAPPRGDPDGPGSGGGARPARAHAGRDRRAAAVRGLGGARRTGCDVPARELPGAPRQRRRGDGRCSSRRSATRRRRGRSTSAAIRLLYGQHLRRAGRRVDARTQLRSAVEAFEGLDAVVWAERARTELRAWGETIRKRDPSTLLQLTPQELQVARMVAEGMSNKDVAGQLFLSPRTIDAHLRNVFSKLGVTSRTPAGAPAAGRGARSLRAKRRAPA